jgi:hypothetical protein
MVEVSDGLPTCMSLESLSLGGVSAMAPPSQLPRKYRTARQGEVSTFQGAGIAPVTRLPDGQPAILLWQAQKGKKSGVRWYDFGGRKKDNKEFTTSCACRKFAKETYGLFGTQIDILDSSDKAAEHLKELYQGLCNLPLMLMAGQEWAQTQILNESPKIFYNDVHEYHTYLLGVPYVPADVLGTVSKIVDGGKRNFKWLTQEDLLREVLAPRLHTESFMRQIRELPEDTWVQSANVYNECLLAASAGSFSAARTKR